MCDLELNFICTYKLLVEDDADDEGMRELLYQMQLLQMFKLDNFNEEAINDKIDKLFDEVKELDFIKNILFYLQILHLEKLVQWPLLLHYHYAWLNL